MIAGVLAQTVALEHYERQVEAILTEFEKLNTMVEKQDYVGPSNLSMFHEAKSFLSGFRNTEKEQHRKLFQVCLDVTISIYIYIYRERCIYIYIGDVSIVSFSYMRPSIFMLLPLVCSALILRVSVQQRIRYSCFFHVRRE